MRLLKWDKDQIVLTEWDGKTIRLGLYGRVSTADKKQTPENQLFAGREITKKRNWFWEEFVDYESGKTNRTKYRLGLEDLIKKIHNNELDGAWIFDESRFARSQEVGHYLIGEIRRSKKFIEIGSDGFVVNDDNYDDSTAMKLGINFMVAEVHTIKHSRSIKSAHTRLDAEAHAKNERIRWGKKPLMGGRRVGVQTAPSGKIVGKFIYDVLIDPVSVKDRYGKGETMRMIAESYGISTKIIFNIINKKYQDINTEQLKKIQKTMQNDENGTTTNPTKTEI